ncbi:hypothetical protein [Sphingomonas pituitosa]|uniref:hypothetical protein n=1 Tax=Sphingomonas pituitosa TaxID=99597 RepID=UPI000A8A70F3|nr:hypothetical protein [Sphingomonas pituitosa]
MEISIGAVGAALIAGLVSVLGLILGKEQKTSEFRQAWIDAIRAEMVSYVTNMNSVVDKIEAGFESSDDRIKSLAGHYADLNKANFNIKMRLNWDEAPSKKILDIMERFEKIASEDENFNADEIKPLEEEFVAASRDFLKCEWVRVKRGEKSFIVAKRVAIVSTLLMAVAAITLFIISLFGNNGVEKKNQAPTINMEYRVSSQGGGRLHDDSNCAKVDEGAALSSEGKKIDAGVSQSTAAAKNSAGRPVPAAYIGNRPAPRAPLTPCP